MYKKLFYWISSTIFLFTLLMLLRPETVLAASSGTVSLSVEQSNVNVILRPEPSDNSNTYIVDQWVPFYTTSFNSYLDSNSYYDIALYPNGNISFDTISSSQGEYFYYTDSLRITEAYCTGFNGDVFTGNIVGNINAKVSFKGTSYYSSGTQRITIYLHVQGTLTRHVTTGGSSYSSQPWWTFTNYESWTLVFNKSNANDVVDQTLINNTKSKINTDNNSNAAAENNLLNQYDSLTDGSYSTADTIDPDWTASDLQTNTSKFTFVSNLITSVWNNLGDFQILLTTGLIVSFCMFLLNVATSRKKGS